MDAGGAGAGFSGKDGWGKVLGLLAGVLVADDLPLFNVRLSRPASGTRGDGASPEAEGSSVNGEPVVRPLSFSLLYSFRAISVCWRRYSWTLAPLSMRRSVFPVAGFIGIKLHLSFLVWHCLHGPVDEESQTSPRKRHREHCHRLLALGRLKER